jgi:hypothetical protein
MKTYVYWRIRHDVFGEIDPVTGWFRLNSILPYRISLKQVDACGKKGISLDYSPAISVYNYADKKTALFDLNEIRKYRTKAEQNKFHLVKVTVRRK